VKLISVIRVVIGLAVTTVPEVHYATAATTGNAAGPVIETSDIDRFYKVFDKAYGHPTGEALQRDYIDHASDGMHVLARMRNVTGQSIADAISKRPEIYSKLRGCLEVLPQVRENLTISLLKLKELYPEARFPPITITVGRGSPVGVGTRDTGVQIGAEALCATDWINPDIQGRFVGVIMHEFAHVQQTVAFSELENPTVLSASLEEGAAEFITELTTGAVSYSYMKRLVAGRETEIEIAFAADAKNTDLSDWLYNSTPDTPADLGYWVGYRIVKSYFQHAQDERQAIREILQMTNPDDFLTRSGWRPGSAGCVPE